MAFKLQIMLLCIVIIFCLVLIHLTRFQRKIIIIDKRKKRSTISEMTCRI